MARHIGDGYTWIDHTKGIVARTPEQLEAATEEDLAWSDLKWEIEHTHDAGDVMVVQAVVTQTLTGTWRSVEGHGQQVRREICNIVRFDDQGRIIGEECYEDALSIMRQLGAVSV